MATTTHHALRYPVSTDPNKPRIDIQRLAEDVDTKMPKITSGTGTAPTTGNREGDIYLRYE